MVAMQPTVSAQMPGGSVAMSGVGQAMGAPMVSFPAPTNTMTMSAHHAMGGGYVGGAVAPQMMQGGTISSMGGVHHVVGGGGCMYGAPPQPGAQIFQSGTVPGQHLMGGGGVIHGGIVEQGETIHQDGEVRGLNGEHYGGPQMGHVTQEHHPSTVHMDPEHATEQIHRPTTEHVRETGPSHQIAGRQYEIEHPPQIVDLEDHQHVQGETQQQIVEIPTTQVVEEVHEIPEVMMRDIHQVVDVPKIISQGESIIARLSKLSRCQYP